MSQKPTILVVDNDPDVIEQLTVVLEGAGYTVAAAESREQAEEVLLGLKPDVAILDLMMEEMDSGFVLAHHLRQLHPETPIILLTAVTSATGLSFGAQSPGAQSAEARSWLKADSVLDKPVRPDQIRAEVRRLLDAARHRNAKPTRT